MAWIAATLLTLLQRASGERGQNSFEYLLVVGAVVAVMILGLLGLSGLIAPILHTACGSLDPLGDGNCLGV